jgi:hypothetical protein
MDVTILLCHCSSACWLSQPTGAAPCGPLGDAEQLDLEHVYSTQASGCLRGAVLAAAPFVCLKPSLATAYVYAGVPHTCHNLCQVECAWPERILALLLLVLPLEHLQQRLIQACLGSAWLHSARAVNCTCRSTAVGKA